MNRTKIEWTDYTVNPIKGLCKGGCWYCYARRMYHRFKKSPDIYLKPYTLEKISYIRRPSRIFVCSTHDLFGDWIPDEWIEFVIQKAKENPKHTFQFLTKNPKRYLSFEFPKNCWLGVTITKQEEDWRSAFSMPHGIKFISIEPLLGELILADLLTTHWIIIGAMTGPGSKKYQPRPEWIQDILTQADSYNIPVFMKNNLRPYWIGKLRQERPV